jgi:hypothetical protein
LGAVMSVISTPFGAAVVCGQCGARYEFPRSFDRRLPLSAAFAAGWGTARTDKGTFDHACPDCLTVDRSPRTIPDDPLLPNEPRQVDLRKQLAAMLAMPVEAVRAIYVEGSGCYGRNGHEDAAADAALLARAVGQPVRGQARKSMAGWTSLFYRPRWSQGRHLQTSARACN